MDENDSEDWPLYTKAEPNYFILHSEKRGTGKGPRAHTCAFWNEFMPVITTGTSSRKLKKYVILIYKQGNTFQFFEACFIASILFCSLANQR